MYLFMKKTSWCILRPQLFSVSLQADCGLETEKETANKPWHPTGNRFLVPFQPLIQPRPQMHINVGRERP
jgi:hypothetical protein